MESVADGDDGLGQESSACCRWVGFTSVGIELCSALVSSTSLNLQGRDEHVFHSDRSTSPTLYPIRTRVAFHEQREA